MKDYSTYFAGYRYRRYAAALWLADLLWAAGITVIAVFDANDWFEILAAALLIFAGISSITVAALHFVHLSRAEFAKIRPLIGVVSPFDWRYGQ
jgi:hypothetical protein